MEMLPSLSRITMAMLGFVAILALHESLMSTTGATQVASSVETVSAPSAIDRSDAADVAVNDALDVDSPSDIAAQGNDTSDQGIGTMQVSNTESIDAFNASSGELQDTVTGELQDTVTGELQDTVTGELQDTVTGELEDAVTGELEDTVTVEPEATEQAGLSGSEDAIVPSASPTSVATANSTDRQWSAVWRPFFSPTTAQGFADYISESTGLTLRVQPAQIAGHYLVEVQHSTEAERIDADRRIVEYTGFKPPGAVQ